MVFLPKKNRIPTPEPQPVLPPKKHEHHWQDFPPYISYVINDSEYDIKIIEPYVCLDCKERKDIILTREKRTGSHVYQEGEQLVKRLEKQYKGFIEDRLIVEDKINDIIHVDNEYNKYWRLIHGVKNPGNSKEPTSTLELKL